LSRSELCQIDRFHKKICRIKAKHYCKNRYVVFVLKAASNNNYYSYFYL